jgi:hypothetical protein
MASEVTEPQGGSPAAEEPAVEEPAVAESEVAESDPEPAAVNPPETNDPTAVDETTTAGAVVQAQGAHPTPASSVTAVEMPLHIFVLATAYLIALITLFIIYVSWHAFRSDVPASFGQLPVGIVWFAATGAVIASLYGIFVHNKAWDPSYNYWHYCRPVFGAVTGSIGALIYLVLLNLGSKSSIKVDSPTFYVVAFVFGFADKSFMQMLQNVTSVIIKPGGKAAPVNPKGPSNGAGSNPSDG